MPCTDPRDVTRLDEAFDLTTTDIQPWELDLIWKAEELGVLRISRHAKRAARDESIPIPMIHTVVARGIPRSKDVTTDEHRRPGINFERKQRARRWIRAKVTWGSRYWVATVHTL
jgi:hypothetical protein